MPKCIYCRTDLNDNRPPNDLTKSQEHIIPLALGGSSEFTTWDTSSKYNHDFGSRIDAPFMNQPPIAILRHMLGLRGHGGTIPPIEWRGRSMNNNEPMRITINHDGSVEYRAETTVIDDKHPTYSHRLVGGSREEVRKILAGMLGKAQAKKQTLYTEHGQVLSSLEEMEAAANIEITDLIRFSIHPIDYEIWARGIIKIALGFCHVILGEDWTFSTDGDRLRSLLFLPRNQWPQVSLKWLFANRLSSEITRFVGITPEVRAAKCHTLAILPNVKPIAIISLFGGHAIFESMIELGSERGRLTEHNLLTNPKVGLRIFPQTRRIEWIMASDLVSAIPPDSTT